MKLWTVEATLENPGCYHAGFEYEIDAASAGEAIKIARGRVRNDGHTRQDGKINYRAQRA